MPFAHLFAHESYEIWWNGSLTLAANLRPEPDQEILGEAAAQAQNRS